MTRLFAIGFLLAFATNGLAHVGSPNVFFNGKAGSYSVFAVVRPPKALPGAAQISVKISDGGVHSVFLLPILWQAGSERSPEPIRAQLFSGETNFWEGEIWLLRPGS